MRYSGVMSASQTLYDLDSKRKLYDIDVNMMYVHGDISNQYSKCYLVALSTPLNFLKETLTYY